MKIIDGLEYLKGLGITKLCGMSEKQDIDCYIENARACHDNAIKYAPMSENWQYSLEHEDDSFMIEVDGHHIIATKYSTFCMPTYGDYDNEEEMQAAFDEWQIQRQAEELADEKIKQGIDFPRSLLVKLFASELRTAMKVAEEQFKKDFPN